MRQWQNKHTYDSAQEHELTLACKHIYKCGYVVTGNAADAILGNKCVVPTHVSPLFFFPVTSQQEASKNAFAGKLSKFGLDHYGMFVVDLLHEFELGVWKATFSHLLWMLYAAGRDLLQVVNKR